MLSWPTTDSDPVTQLVRTHRGIHAGTDPAVLRRAYTIAENMHRGQFRKSGEPYITHPLAVAQICAELGMDTTTLVAALLHDTVEDTRYTLQALSEDFGGEVAHLVDGVTKFDKAFYGKAAEAETIRKMIVAAAKDVRVLIIKLADRLHNMRTLGCAPRRRGNGSPARPRRSWSRSVTGWASRPSNANWTTWCCCTWSPTSTPGWPDTCTTGRGGTRTSTRWSPGPGWRCAAAGSTPR